MWHLCGDLCWLWTHAALFCVAKVYAQTLDDYGEPVAVLDTKGNMMYQPYQTMEEYGNYGTVMGSAGSW